jgi:predicted TIM-barrel fold metal-dependent hydrolase
MGVVEAVDVHQHLWSEPLVEALAARSDGPRVRRDGRAWRLDLPDGSAAYLPVETAQSRAARLRAGGLDRALIALPAELAVERLPAEEAAPLLAAHAAVTDEAPALAPWASTSLVDLDAAVAELPERLEGSAGLCLPAAALASPQALDRLGPLLEALARSGRPLLVHPGAAAAPGTPAWWSELAGDVAQQQAAWLAFADGGRLAHPGLRVVFAGLAGLAPLQFERAVARGGPSAAVRDPNLFYDTSAYGSFAIEATARVVGAGQLVHGTDLPAAEPPAGPAADGLDAADWEAMATVNAARLLGGARREAAVPAPLAAAA